MKSQQLSQAGIADRLPMGPLDNVQIRRFVAFYEYRPHCRQAYVPAYQRTVAESGVCPSGEIQRLLPEGQLPAQDFDAAVRMAVGPEAPPIEAHITGGAADSAGADIDLGGNATGMEIVDHPIIAARHPENCVGRFISVLLVAAGKQSHCGERSVAQVGNVRMVDEALLHYVAVPSGNRLDMFEQLVGTQHLTAAAFKGACALIIPPFGAAAAFVFGGLDKKICFRQ